MAQWVKNPQESTCNAGDKGDASSIPGSGRYPGGGNDNPLQYFCLENSMDRRAWWATIQGVPKSQTWLRTRCIHTHTHTHTDTQTHTHRDTQTDRQTHTQTHIQTHTHTQTHIQTHTHTKTHTHTHTHRNTHTHTQNWITLLYTWNIVNQLQLLKRSLFFGKLFFKKKYICCTILYKLQVYNIDSHF